MTIVYKFISGRGNKIIYRFKPHDNIYMTDPNQPMGTNRYITSTIRLTPGIWL